MTVVVKDILDGYLAGVAGNSSEDVFNGDNQLKTISEDAASWVVANYILLFGNPNKRDLHGEFFTKNTVWNNSSYVRTGVTAVDFEHGFEKIGGLGRDQVLGRVLWDTVKIDDIGVFVQRALDRQNRYIEALKEAAEEGLLVLGSSSEAIPQMVQKADGGEILVWPIRRDSLTMTPAAPEMIGANRIRTLKTVIDDSSESVYKLLEAVLLPTEKSEADLKEAQERVNQKRAEVNQSIMQIREGGN